MPGPNKPDKMENTANLPEEEQFGRMTGGVVDDLSQASFGSGDMVDEPEDGVNAYETLGEAQPIDQQAINEEEKNKSEAPTPFDTGIPDLKPD